MGGVVVEVDGMQHLAVEGWVDETLRQNGVILGDRRVLRVPLLGLRLAPEQFLDQVEAALRRGGWRG